MPAQPVTRRYTAGSRGIITEGNALAAVEDSTLEESNYERLTDLTARRRRPILEEEEDRSSYLPIDYAAVADFGTGVSGFQQLNSRHTSVFIWHSPAHREDISILVEEVGNIVRFYLIRHNTTEEDGFNEYMREFKFSDELWLELWGQSGTTEVLPEERRPCTYAEGDGSLYIFNNVSGTIRIDLSETLTRAVGGLQFTPIGTWIRDFVGAAEGTDPDFRFRSTDPELGGAGILFNGQPIPVDDVDDLVAFSSELGDTRAYNLTNTGWPEADIVAFRDQSEEDYRVYSQFRLRGSVLDPDINRYFVVKQRNAYEYPALQDRYLDGRTINEDGQDVFTFGQLNEAQRRTGEPIKGSKVGSSDYHPAGSLQPLPVDMINSQEATNPNEVLVASITPAGLVVNVRYNRPHIHSVGREDDNIAIFVHRFTFVVTVPDENGIAVDRVGGFSGVVEGRKLTGFPGNESLFRTQFVHNVGSLLGVILATPQNQSSPMTNTQHPGTFWAHPAPTHSPHRLPDNGGFYDYRRQKRPTSGAFFANRLWQLADEHDRIYYSQIVTGGNNRVRSQDIVRESLCYAAASPTDGEDSQVVATDGGYIYLPNSGTHIGATVLGQTLYVMTDTSIYAVRPGGAGFFLPDDFSISKVIDAEVISQKAWINTGLAIHVATSQGILKITAEGVENLTIQSIKSLYQELTGEFGRVEAMASWNQEEQLVRWVFSPKLFGITADPNGQTSQEDIRDTLDNNQTTMLTYSERFSHWFRYDLSKGGIISDVLMLPYAFRNDTYNRFRYLAITRNETGSASAAWALETAFDDQGESEWIEGTEKGFRDYRVTGSPTQETVRAFMLTNHQLYGDGHSFSQIHYLIAHNQNVTSHMLEQEDGTFLPNIDGSTLCSVQWDWADNNEFWGKFSPVQETYKFRRSYFPTGGSATEEVNRGEPILVRKLKIRGRGREFRILWESQDEKDSHLVGWNIVGLILPSV